jgi:uncharacterized coiled-coil protein SlyX
MSTPDVSAPAPSAELFRAINQHKDMVHLGAIERCGHVDCKAAVAALLRSDAERSTTPTPCAACAERVAALMAEREDLSEQLTEQHEVVRQMRASMNAVTEREGALRRVAYEFYVEGKGHNASWPVERAMRAALGMESEAERHG